MAIAFFEALGNLFKKPATTLYPFEPTFKPDDYRGLIAHNPELCIWCRKCEIVCPPGAIVFSQAMDGKQTYHYSPYACIYCGECVRNCPKDGALIQTATPGSAAVKHQNINNLWNQEFKDALLSRAAYMEEKKKQRAAADSSKNDAQAAE